MHVWVSATEARCSAAHSAHWQKLELKGFYDTHAQLTSVWYKHAKRRVRYVYIRKH